MGEADTSSSGCGGSDGLWLSPYPKFLGGIVNYSKWWNVHDNEAYEVPNVLDAEPYYIGYLAAAAAAAAAATTRSPRNFLLSVQDIRVAVTEISLTRIWCT